MRILIVEDEADIHRYYAKALKRANAEFDIAESRVEAFDFLRVKCYEAAIVDLNLTDDHSFSHGKEVLSLIREIGEGTIAVVVSGTANISDAVDSYEGGAVKFIEKSRSTNQEVAEYVIKIADDVKLDLFGEFGSLNAYLASPEVIPVWEMQIYEALKCGFDKMQHAIMHSFKDFLPIRRRSDGSPSFDADVEQKIVVGTFWSRRIGSAIRVTLSPDLGSIEQGRSKNSTVAKNGGIGRSIFYEVELLENQDCDQFFERIGDTKVVK